MALPPAVALLGFGVLGLSHYLVWANLAGVAAGEPGVLLAIA